MKNKLFENLKSTLGEETVKDISVAFTEALEDGVKLKLAEKVKELEAKSEEFVTKKVAKLVESKEKALIAEYEEKQKDYSEWLVGKLDNFLEAEAVESISESVIEDVAKVRMYEPIVKKIMEAFGEHYAPVGAKDSNEALATSLTENTELRKMYEKAIGENKKLVEMAERSAVRVKFTESTLGLGKKAKQQIWEMVKDMDFETAERKIPTLVAMVEEFSDVGDDTSVGGVGGSDDIDAGAGDDTEGDDDTEVTYPLSLSKEAFDAIQAIEVGEGEDTPIEKQFADLVAGFVVEPEEGDEVDESVVEFDVPESAGEEIRSMFTTEDGEIDEESFGGISDELKDAIIEFIGTLPGSEDEGEDDGEGEGEPEGAEPKADIDNWQSKWGSK